MKALGLAVLLAAALGQSASMQTRPDFTGTWEFLSSSDPASAIHGAHGHGYAGDELCGQRCAIVQDGQLLKITPITATLPGETKLFPLDGVEYKRVAVSRGAAPGVDYTAQAKWVDDNIEIKIVEREALRTGGERRVETMYVLWHRTDAMTIEIAKEPAPAVKTSTMFAGRPSPSRLHYKKR